MTPDSLRLARKYEVRVSNTSVPGVALVQVVGADANRAAVRCALTPSAALTVAALPAIGVVDGSTFVALHVFTPDHLTCELRAADLGYLVMGALSVRGDAGGAIVASLTETLYLSDWSTK